MSIVTIRKFVTVFFTITVLMALNALIHQSVFMDFELCNSHRSVKTDSTDTNGTFSAPSTLDVQDETRISMKPIQNGESGESISCDLASEISPSASQSDFEFPGGEKLNFEDSPEIPKKYSLESNYSTYSEKSDSDLADQKSEFMCNAPWPFSKFRIFTPPKRPVNKLERSVSTLPPRSTVIADVQTDGETEVTRITPYIEFNPNSEDVSPTEDEKSGSEPPSETQSVAGTQIDLPPDYHIAPRGVPAPAPVPQEVHQEPIGKGLVLESPAPPQKTPELELPAIGSESLEAFAFESESAPEAEAPEAEENAGSEVVQTFESNPPQGNFIREKSPEPPQDLASEPPQDLAPEPPQDLAPESPQDLASEPPQDLAPESPQDLASEPLWEFSSEPLREPSQIATLEDAGNFPLSEPEVAPINTYFGVKKPVILPDVPHKKEKAEDLMTIDGISDLPELPEPSEPLELRNFPPVE